MTQTPEPFSDQEAVQLTESLILSLPPELVAAIEQQMRQSGQTQTQVVLQALRLGLHFEPIPTAKPPTESIDLQQELAKLKGRLAELEFLVPKVEALEGKLIAF